MKVQGFIIERNYRYKVIVSTAPNKIYGRWRNINRNDLVINRNGNVGIGSAPGVLLDVHKDSTSGQLAEYRNDTGYFLHRTYADYNNDGTTVEFQTRVGLMEITLLLVIIQITTFL